MPTAPCFYPLGFDGTDFNVIWMVCQNKRSIHGKKQFGLSRRENPRRRKVVDRSATDESQLEIQNDEGEILYTFVGSKLFRNNDLAMENLKTCQFSQVDGNSIGIYIRTAEDNIIDLRISR